MSSDYTRVLRLVSEAYGKSLELSDVASSGHNPVLFADSPDGPVVIKWSSAPSAEAKSQYIGRVKAVLQERGYPASRYIFTGAVVGVGFVTIQPQFRGSHPTVLTQALMDDLLRLIRLQYDAPEGVVEYNPQRLHAVVAEDLLNWWGTAAGVDERSALLCERLSAWVQQVGPPAPKHDFVHGDLHVENLLVEGDAITGVIDFQDCGVGDANIDLINVGFEWQAMQCQGVLGLAKSPWESIRAETMSRGGDASWRYCFAYNVLDRLAWIAAKPVVRLGKEVRIRSVETTFAEFGI